MKMNNIIKFYAYTNTLKHKLRQGWLDVGIKSERIESIAEHIYGTLVLALAIDSEFDLGLDMLKVLKMLTLHELEEILMPDYTIRDDIPAEEKNEQGSRVVHKVTEDLINQSEIEKLLEEFNAHESKESIFCYHIDKIEADLQNKMYELNNETDFEKSKEDIMAYMGEKGKAIIEESETANDIWLAIDRHHYEDDKLFMDLWNAIKEYKG